MTKNYGLVQIWNPKLDRYLKIDRDKGLIIGHKSTVGPWKNIPIITKVKEYVEE